jgi:lipopolysaccharide assembly outer membrane protein LptD (OstA)
MYSDETKDFTADGSLEVIQGKKISIAKRAIYLQPSSTIILSGDVKTVIEKARALLKEGTAEKLKSDDAKKLLREKTVLISDSLEFKTKSGDAKAVGNVHVSQKNNEAKADSALYSDEQESIDLEGNVFLKKEKQWIKCQKVLVSIKNETFTATGSVEAEFKIKKKK